MIALDKCLWWWFGEDSLKVAEAEVLSGDQFEKVTHATAAAHSYTLSNVVKLTLLLTEFHYISPDL